MFNKLYNKAKNLFRNITWRPNPTQFQSNTYWENRYLEGGTSGAGSYGILAEFKAEIINWFVQENNIVSVIEFGCGDGNQLTYLSVTQYIGFDISEEAVNLCKEKFKFDTSKQFKQLTNYSGEKSELTLSLDVIFHLIEDNVFEEHMKLLFDSSTKYVIVYSSNKNKQDRIQAIHVKHRKFTEWVNNNKKDWELLYIIPNKYSKSSAKNSVSSFSNFFIYKKISKEGS